jgi:glycerol-3-phosphate dehydrogenase (NAD(P)+)
VQRIDTVVIIGAGNWGLALATICGKSHKVRVWGKEAAAVAELRAGGGSRTGPQCDAGPRVRHRPASLPSHVVIEEKFAADVNPQTTLFILAVPSGQVRNVARELGSRYREPLVVSVSKGFDAERQRTMSQVIQEEIPGAHVVVLTGPTIANEVAAGKPTRAVLACADLMHLALVKDILKNDVISFEVGREPSHHEICAALKGIVAIAVGLAEGLELGANAQGVLVAEGLREMAVVASFFGIPESVAYGVSGAGDLITTCISPDSRNRRLGILLAKGMTLNQALREVQMTVEGVAMSKTIETLWSLDVSIPLFHMVHDILSGRTPEVRRELAHLIRRL